MLTLFFMHGRRSAAVSAAFQRDSRPRSIEVAPKLCGAGGHDARATVGLRDVSADAAAFTNAKLPLAKFNFDFPPLCVFGGNRSAGSYPAPGPV